MPLLKTHTTHHLKLNQQVMIAEFSFPPLRPGGNVPWSWWRRGLLFHLTFRGMCCPPGYEAFWFTVLKRVSFWKKRLPESLEVGVNTANLWSTWVAPVALLKLFILWCHLFNKIFNSVCEINQGRKKKYSVLHRVTKGTEFEGLSRANIYKTWDHGLWMTLVDLCLQDPFYGLPQCPNYLSFWRRTIPVIWPNFRDFNNIGLYYYH